MNKLSILIIATFFFSNLSFAKCNLKYELGDPISKMENDIGGSFPHKIPGVKMYPILSEAICPNEKLDGSIIEYKFVDDKLVAYNLVVLNDEQDNRSEELKLMKYVKKVYGNFDTGNPQSYRGFKIFEKGNQFIVYQKADGPNGFVDEQLYISDKVHDEILMKHMEKYETGQLAEEYDRENE